MSKKSINQSFTSYTRYFCADGSGDVVKTCSSLLHEKYINFRPSVVLPQLTFCFSLQPLDSTWPKISAKETGTQIISATLRLILSPCFLFSLTAS